MATIGSLVVNLTAQTAAFRADMAKATRTLNSSAARMNRSLAGMRRGFDRLRSSMVTFIGAFAGLRVITSMVSTMGDFEQAMNRVRAISGATAEQFGRLQQQARELGATTVFTAGQAAAGMAFLAQAGFKTNQIIAAMPGVLDLAAASQLELGQTADIVSNIMQGFGLQASDTGRAVDVLTATFTSSNTDLMQLGEAMKLVAPIAQGMGLSFEETAATIGLLGNAGLQATLAGTSLRQSLNKLAKPTAEAKQLLKGLGINAFDASGKIRSMSEIIDQLAKSGATTTQMLEIFGVRAGPGMQVLLVQGSKALRDFTDKVSTAGGIAKKVADIQMEGLKGQIRALKSAWDELTLAFGDTGALNTLTAGITSLKDLLRDASDGFIRVRVGLLQMNLALARLIGPEGAVEILEQELAGAVRMLNIFDKGLSFEEAKEAEKRLAAVNEQLERLTVLPDPGGRARNRIAQLKREAAELETILQSRRPKPAAPDPPGLPGGPSPETAAAITQVKKLASAFGEVRGQAGEADSAVRRLAISSSTIAHLEAEARELEEITTKLAESFGGVSKQAGEADNAVRRLTGNAQGIRELEAATDEFEASLVEAEASGRLFASIVSSGLASAIVNAQNLRDAITNIARALAQAIIQAQIFNAIMGAQGFTGGATSPSFSPTGGGTGGAAPVTVAAAHGAITRPGQSFLVGERGPEIFKPGQTGRIVPNDQLAGTTIIINAQGAAPGTEARLLANLRDIQTRAIAIAVQVTRDNRRRGKG